MKRNLKFRKQCIVAPKAIVHFNSSLSPTRILARLSVEKCSSIVKINTFKILQSNSPGCLGPKNSRRPGSRKRKKQKNDIEIKEDSSPLVSEDHTRNNYHQFRCLSQ